MSEYIVLRTGNVFKSMKYSEKFDDWDKAWMQLDIDVEYGGCRIISVVLRHPENRYSGLKFSKLCEGYYTNSSPSEYKVCWEITDLESNMHKCIIQGPVYRDFGVKGSVAQGIAIFFNKLFQFQSITDYETFELCQKEAYTSENLKSRDWLIGLSNLIELLQKYNNINPCSVICNELESTIIKRIKNLQI